MSAGKLLALIFIVILAIVMFPIFALFAPTIGISWVVFLGFLIIGIVLVVAISLKRITQSI